MTREEWLTRAVNVLDAQVFAPQGLTVPAVRVSVGWPGGRGNKDSTIGQCWASIASADGRAQLFISPTMDDAVRVLDILAHEMIHAVDDCQNGHKGEFRRMALAIGLTGKMTATVAGDDLRAELTAIAGELGPYPHAALTPALSGIKKQTTRMLKLECPDDGYIVRTTQKWLDLGLPSCPCGTTMTSA